MKRYEIRRCRTPKWACWACRDGRGPWFVNEIGGDSFIIETPTHAQAVEALSALIGAGRDNKEEPPK